MKIRAASNLFLVLLLLSLVPNHAAGQQRPPDLSTVRTTYSFPIRAGEKPFQFKVDLDPSGIVTGISVFRHGDSSPFQIIPACKDSIKEEPTGYDGNQSLIEHSDLNFDGFEDLQLLWSYYPYNERKRYCIYAWDSNAGRFRYAPEIPSVNPVPHPQNRTISVHMEWDGGGLYVDSIFRWTGSGYELIEESGRVYGSDDPNCSYTDHCDKLINGKMVVTLWRPVRCSDDRKDPPLACPADATRAAPDAPHQKPAIKLPEPQKH